MDEPFDWSETVYVLEVFYIDRGFELDLGGQTGTPPELNRELRFTAVRFFVPTMEGFLDSTGNAAGWQGRLFPWQGFKSFEEYLCLARPEEYPNLCGPEGSP
jgi:hypothetical protein